MKNLYLLNQYRRTDRIIISHYGSAGDDASGVFTIPSVIDGADLTVIASAGEGWDHVSVSRTKRPPNWKEMCQINSMFFGENEVTMQLHVPRDMHINVHPNCLHIWRPWDTAIPLPPSIFVGDLSDPVQKALHDRNSAA